MGQIKRRNVYKVPVFFFFLLVFNCYNLDTFEDDYIYEYYKLFRYNVNKNQRDDKHSGQSLSFSLDSQSFLSFSIKNPCFE